MKEKVCLVFQPAGLGDILFIQKICRHWLNKGYRVILPVIKQYEWLKDYIPDIEFIGWSDNYDWANGPVLKPETDFPYIEKYRYDTFTQFSDDFVYINLSPGNVPDEQHFYKVTGRIMEGRYIFLNMSWEDWSEYFLFNRNIEKENDLYYNILGLKDDEEYVFINRKYKMLPTPEIYHGISINSADYSNKKVIEMDILEKYTIFDWLRVIENASEIHMIETSLNYILETKNVNLKAEKMNLYSRVNNFYEVRHLFNLPWNYITK